MIVSTSDACRVFGIHKSTLTTWKKAGAPGYAGRDQWNLTELVPWWGEHVFRGAEAETESLADIRKTYWQVKTQREELALSYRRGELVERDQAARWLIQLIYEAKAAFLAMPRRLAPVLVGETDPRAIEEAVAREVYAALQRLSRGTKTQPNRRKEKANGR